MTRFAIDAATALRIVREDPPLPDGVQLVGPTVLRSYVLAALYDRAGDAVTASRWFRHIASYDAAYADVPERLRALGR